MKSEPSQNRSKTFLRCRWDLDRSRI